MKNSKYLLLAAIAAATAMVSSCSDNGDLSTPTKEAEGKALVVNPTVLDSRVTPLAKSAFTGFKLYGIQNPTNSSTVGSFVNTGTDYGVNYSGAFGNSAAEVSFTPATTVNWPTENPDNSANFYAISVQGGSDLTGSGITVTNDGIYDGTFSYTAPLDGEGNVDLSKQKDIMIASSLEAKQSTDNGVVTLPFKHAFAKLTLQIRWNYQEWINNGVTSPASVIESNALLVIDYVKIHNIKCNGSYSFTADDGNGGKGKWTVDGENSTIMFKYETPRRFTAQNYTLKDEYLAAHPEVTDPTDEGLLAACNADPFKVQDLRVGDEAIMILPQKLALWENTGSFATNTSGPFIEIHCCAYNTTGASEDEITNINWWDEEAGDIFVEVLGSQDETDRYMTSIYFPIRVNSTTPFTFEANKSYNFRLNVATSRQDNGTNAIKGVVVDPS